MFKLFLRTFESHLTIILKNSMLKNQNILLQTSQKTIKKICLKHVIRFSFQKLKITTLLRSNKFF